MNVDKIQGRVPSKVTQKMRWRNQARIVQEAYNEYKRKLNQNYRQVHCFYYKFRQYEIKPRQPDRTPHQRRKGRVEIQAKLL
jgi:hypothetical protein